MWQEQKCGKSRTKLQIAELNLLIYEIKYKTNVVKRSFMPEFTDNLRSVQNFSCPKTVSKLRHETLSNNVCYLLLKHRNRIQGHRFVSCQRTQCYILRNCSWVHAQHQHNKSIYLSIKSWLLDYIDIDGTRLSSEISHTRTDLTA
jgi:hypothetical protein